MDELRFRAAGVLGQGLVGALFTTIRARRDGEDNYLRFRREGTPVVFVLWHGHLLPLVHYHRREGVAALVSEHTDGEYLTRVLVRHGFEAVRGSSTRGGTKGLKGLIRAARAGRDLAVTPDGPQGPARKFKIGALVAAQVTGSPIVPVAAGASRAWHFDSWDRFMVPRPLARVTLEYGEPHWIEREAGAAELERRAGELEDVLNTLSERARQRAAERGRARGEGA